MAIGWIILLDILIFWFFFGNQVMDWLRFGKWKQRHELSLFRKQYRNLWLRERDILPAEQVAFLEAQQEKLSAVIRQNDASEMAQTLKEQAAPALQAKLPQRHSFPWLRNFLEVAIVSLGVAFGVRALFLQPFKIPTGSMQVTLWGVHTEPICTEAPRGLSGRIRTFFEFMNYSWRRMDLTVQESGVLDPHSVRAAASWPFFPRTSLRIGTVEYIVPGEPERVVRILVEDPSFLQHNNGFFRKGERLLHTNLATGDHLFVDRTSLCFREPKRGDIMVFLTDGLQLPDGQPFGGRFYVKRLVGLPGDELLIKDRKLYVKEPGQKEFRQLTGKDHPGFDKVHSCKNGYRGYLNMAGARYLTSGTDTFKVPEGHYFMLGDNSANSLDSRYWGTVPRKNLMGRPGFVWWPFNTHWGVL